MENAPLHELDPVVLKVDLPEHRLLAGALGVVGSVQDDGLAYEVDFASADGSAAARVRLRRDQLRRSTGEDG